MRAAITWVLIIAWIVFFTRWFFHLADNDGNGWADNCDRGTAIFWGLLGFVPFLYVLSLIFGD